jgi:hypothetical protein
MTVCLAVIGQSVPALGFMGTILQHDVDLGSDLRWYQRLLNRDLDAAVGLLDEVLQVRCFEEVCDQIVIPSLARAELDREQGFIDLGDLRFIYRAVRDWLDDLGSRTEPLPTAERPELGGVNSVVVSRAPGSGELNLVGLASGGAEALILRMINQSLGSSGLRMKILSGSAPPLRVSDRVNELKPALVLVSHLPKEGLSRARYLIRRLRARFADLPVAVGYWDPTADVSRVTDQLRAVSVHHVVLGVASARAFILGRILVEANRGQRSSPRGTETALKSSI